MNTFNFIEEYKIPEKICDDLITYYKKNTEYKNIGQTGLGINKKIKNSTDVSFCALAYCITSSQNFGVSTPLKYQ